MAVSRLAKAIAWWVAAALSVVLAVCLQPGFHSEAGPEDAYFRTNTWLFWIAAVCTGVAIYSYRAYTRQHREHATDSLVLLLVGVVLLIAETMVLVCYGGISNTFTQSGYTACNIQMLLLALLPWPFLARAAVLVFGRSASRPSAVQYGIRVACIALAALIFGLLVSGCLLEFVRYEQPNLYAPPLG